MYELIPSAVFSGDMPDYFVDNFAHWLDIASGEVQFRRNSTVWQPSTSEWALQGLKDHSCRLRSNNKELIERSSPIASAILEVLQVLDKHEDIIITLVDKSAVEVDLHRYNLHFSVTSAGWLRCDEYGYTVHPTQAFGTWTGLENMLVFQDDTHSSDHARLNVLIPYGNVRVREVGAHVSVSIERVRSKVQRHYLFTANKHIGELCGSSDLLGSLFKAYLHAVTSYLLPDELTGRTGTRQALAVLQGAAVFSCSPLDEEVVSLLSKICELTPKREHYPKHLRQMQQVVWNPSLSQLAQDTEFEVMANAINNHSNTFAALHSSKPTIMRSRGDPDLLQRAAHRAYTLQARSGGKFVPVEDYDRIYWSRDHTGSEDRARRIHRFASLVLEWPIMVNTDTHLTATMERWGVIGGFNQSFTQQSFQDLIDLEIPRNWGSLYGLCKTSSKKRSTWHLMFTFCAIAFGHSKDNDSHLRTLLAFAFCRGFATIDPPSGRTSYDLGPGDKATRSELNRLISRHKSSIFERETNPPSYLTKRQRRKWLQDNAYVISQAHDRLLSEISRLVDAVNRQWPTNTIRSCHLGLQYLNEAEAIRSCQASFDVWFSNRRFLEYIGEVEKALKRTWISETVSAPMSKLPPQQPCYEAQKHVPSLEDLLAARPTRSAPRKRRPSTILLAVAKDSAPSESSVGDTAAANRFVDIEEMVSRLASSRDDRRKRYAVVLDASLSSLKERDRASTTNPNSSLDYDSIQRTLGDHKENLAHSIQSAELSIAPETAAERMLEDALLWPQFNKQSLLGQLCPQKFCTLEDEWKQCFVSVARDITSVQRLARILHHLSRNDIMAARDEIQHYTAPEWSPYEYPSWLLLEIENDITIRSLQVRVALEMMQSSSNANSVLQLNMGEGKSSIIIPMLVAACADGKRLVRAIVLKSLLRQTTQLLSQRLGGLLNQKVYHTPFSRQTGLDGGVVEDLQAIYEDCKKHSGVLVALPEHILSFRLMGREKFSSNVPLATRLLKVEDWLEANCRDILDESDEILDVRSQLVYTVGSQEMLDGQPDRWLTMQGLLHRVAIQAASLSKSHPELIEIDLSGNGFPFIQFLSPTAVPSLMKLVVQDVFKGHVMGLCFDYFGSNVRKALERFVRDRTISAEDVRTVVDACQGSLHYPSILVLRGMFAHNILSFAIMRKRWLVEYGLDSQRCLMAVPYRAKGVPSINAVWGHPDVAILLTCLSYYHTGLTNAQIRQSFGLLIKNSGAADEYSRWCESCNVPTKFKVLEAVNLEDANLCHNELFPKLRYSRGLSDFFMRRVVFPKEGKLFKNKISTSAWDIPSTQLTPENITTGFSGTNDNRFLLPLSIEQRDLPELLHTNAYVINLILEPENRTYVCAMDEAGKKLGTPRLLSLITQQSHRITVLIDVGAQILDMTNQQVASAWLQVDPNALCSLFFNADDEATVLDRRGLIVPLRISPFRSKLDKCLIYLDEVHTRGIDLKLPVGLKAAVTLGPRLVKDRLSQGKLSRFCGYFRDIH